MAGKNNLEGEGHTEVSSRGRSRIVNFVFYPNTQLERPETFGFELPTPPAPHLSSTGANSRGLSGNSALPATFPLSPPCETNRQRKCWKGEGATENQPPFLRWGKARVEQLMERVGLGPQGCVSPTAVIALGPPLPPNLTDCLSL